ncbi:LexA family transcriptional regulator [Sphingobacterium suaedae]|uniref:Helix-turn-helix domain-containing protein n=1 Tax=Sphingobacterium suaedae TaxID=1686402 RepID=A0ABW5KFG2_9SPHI
MDKIFNIVSYLKQELGLSGSKIAKDLGVSPQFISNISRGKPIGLEVAKKIAETYNLTIDFVLHGKISLSMLGDQKPVPSSRSNARDIGDPTTYDENGDTKFIEISPGRYRMGTELVPVYAQAGYLSGYMDKEYLEELPKHYITVDKYVRGKYRSFEISGHSMDNGDIKEAMPDGTIATGRLVKREHWQSRLHNHQWPNWIFVHKTEGIITKQIAHQDLENGILILRSLNPDKEKYPDFDVCLDDIEEIYNVVKRELR